MRTLNISEDNVFTIENFNRDIWTVTVYYTSADYDGCVEFPELMVVKLSATDNHGVTMDITDTACLNEFHHQYYEAILEAVYLDNRKKRALV